MNSTTRISWRIPEEFFPSAGRTVRFLTVSIVICFLLPASFATPARAAAEAIADKTAEVDGLKLHYLTAGHGPTVILLHGYTQTSRMWRPIIPLLAGKFTVIAPDLPGIGDSDIPKDGLDMKDAAIRIHALAKSLQVEKARVVGHDIGLMVAYAYAAMYPGEVEKLVVMDAFLPGVEGWEPYYNNPDLWHFRFHGPTPEALVAGREKIYFAYFWNDLAADKTRSLPWPTARPMSRPTPVPDGCAPRGLTLLPGRKPRTILPSWPKRN